jgi:hypothetical protein
MIFSRILYLFYNIHLFSAKTQQILEFWLIIAKIAFFSKISQFLKQYFQPKFTKTQILADYV